jgi:hypothetical protein
MSELLAELSVLETETFEIEVVSETQIDLASVALPVDLCTSTSVWDCCACSTSCSCS